MAPTYTIMVSTEFAASHALRGYSGDCAQLHGHNWKVDVEVSASALNDLGMAIDFKALRAAARAAVDRFDHRHLNDLPPFTSINPTAENIAATLFAAIGTLINSPQLRLSAVTVHETDRAAVRYQE